MEEAKFYKSEVSKWAVCKDGVVHFPRLFGFPAWKQRLEFYDPCPAEPLKPEYIRCAGQKITQFKLHMVKQNAGGFRLRLVFDKVHFQTTCSLDQLSWPEFALYLSFALSHGKVTFIPVLEALVIEPCLGIPRQELF